MRLKSHERKSNRSRFCHRYLRANPDFLLRHPELFLHLSLPGQAPDGSRTPAECQNEALKAALSSCQIKEEERRLRESSLSSDAKSEEIIRFATDLLACHSQVELPNSRPEFLYF